MDSEERRAQVAEFLAQPTYGFGSVFGWREGDPIVLVRQGVRVATGIVVDPRGPIVEWDFEADS